MKRKINFKKYTHVEIKQASQTGHKPRNPGGWSAFQYMNTTESMYNSTMREKSFIEHFEEGVHSSGGTPAALHPAALGAPASAPEPEASVVRGEMLARSLRLILNL